MPTEPLYAAVVGLATAIGVMFRMMVLNHAECVEDRRKLWEHFVPRKGGDS